MVKHIKKKTAGLKESDAALIRANEQLQKEINECRDLERQLRLAHEFDKALLKTLPMGIDIVDEEGNLLYISEKMEKNLAKKALGRKCYLLYKDDKKQCDNCPLKDGVQIGETKGIEVKGMMAGKAFFITHTGMFYQGKKAILEFFEDITDYKKAQEQLAFSQRLSGIGRMAGVIAHEFRNQLAVIRNTVYFLKMKITDKDEKVMRHLEILDEQVTETESIIANILAFSQNKQPELKTVDLRSLLLASIKKVTIPEGIELTGHIGDFPLLEIDPVQISEVFVNIILNAIQAMGEKGKLLIQAAKINNYVTIVFKDTGGGIKEENRARLFEPFFSTKARGTGLGLATARIIIEGHGGSINLESEYGRGTQAIIKLPLKSSGFNAP